MLHVIVPLNSEFDICAHYILAGIFLCLYFYYKKQQLVKDR